MTLSVGDILVLEDPNRAHDIARKFRVKLVAAEADYTRPGALHSVILETVE
jgi:hypothetical protein